MASTFFDRIDELSDAVGHGTLGGKVVVDQVYAHIQEVAEEFRHPHGGRVYALRDALYEGSNKRMTELAARAITPEGSEIKQGMIDAAEGLSGDYFEYAPREWGDLRASGHPTATDDGAVYYDRPPHVHRLSEDELRAKGQLRGLFHFEGG